MIFCITRSRKVGVAVVAKLDNEVVNIGQGQLDEPTVVSVRRTDGDENDANGDGDDGTAQRNGSNALSDGDIDVDRDSDSDAPPSSGERAASDNKASARSVNEGGGDALRSSRTVLIDSRDDYLEFQASYSAFPSGQLPRPKTDRFFETLWGWPISLYRIKDSDVLSRCGTDGFLYLTFSRWTVYLLAFVTVLSLCIALPVNMSGEKDATGVRRTSIRFVVARVPAQRSMTLVGALLAATSLIRRPTAPSCGRTSSSFCSSPLQSISLCSAFAASSARCVFVFVVVVVAHTLCHKVIDKNRHRESPHCAVTVRRHCVVGRRSSKSGRRCGCAICRARSSINAPFAATLTVRRVSISSKLTRPALAVFHPDLTVVQIHVQLDCSTLERLLDQRREVAARRAFATR